MSNENWAAQGSAVKQARDWNGNESKIPETNWPFTGQTGTVNVPFTGPASPAHACVAGNNLGGVCGAVGSIKPATGDMRDYFPDGVKGYAITYDPTDGMVKGSAYIGGCSDVSQVWLDKAAKKKHAYTFLETAVKEMKDRAAQRDLTNVSTNSPSGERSMAATIKAFNALTGHNLTEENGWEFMILLKLVRGRQGDFRADDYVDAAAYSALLGECASTARGE